MEVGSLLVILKLKLCVFLAEVVGREVIFVDYKLSPSQSTQSS